MCDMNQLCVICFEYGDRKCNGILCGKLLCDKHFKGNSKICNVCQSKNAITKFKIKGDFISSYNIPEFTIILKK
jgi:hypothetical protein